MPLRSSMVNGSVLIHPVIPTSSGAIGLSPNVSSTGGGVGHGSCVVSDSLVGTVVAVGSSIEPVPPVVAVGSSVEPPLPVVAVGCDSVAVATEVGSGSGSLPQARTAAATAATIRTRDYICEAL